MKTITTISANGIKVTEHIPEAGDVPDYIREHKINQLYDLLAPKEPNSTAEHEDEIF